MKTSVFKYNHYERSSDIVFDGIVKIVGPGVLTAIIIRLYGPQLAEILHNDAIAFDKERKTRTSISIESPDPKSLPDDTYLA